MKALFATDFGRFRLLGIVEGISFLLILGVTMPLKYAYDTPGPNKVLGMAHGVLFIAYCFYALSWKWERGWSWGKLGLAWLASVVPFGTFAADYYLFRGEDGR